jgi:hypothetical protein
MQKYGQKKNAEEKVNFSFISKVTITLLGVCLLLSYYGIIKGSFAHIIAGVAVVVGMNFLKNGISKNQVDRLN